MPSDPSRVLREYALEPLRRELRVAGSRVLVIATAREAAELAETAVDFDAAWIELENVAGLDLPALGREAARVLKPGARLVCVVPGARPLPRLASRALLGEATAREAVRGVSFSEWRRAFGSAVAWNRARGFGVLVPPGESWERLHPLAIGALAALEHAVGGWPLLRGMGERLVHEGVRR